jgi:transposase
MAAVMIGVDPHKASHTAVAISAAEEPLGELRVRACVAQAERLLAWAAAWPQRTWAVEGAGGTGHLLAQQLVSAGERVLDVQPKLGARVRLLAAGDVNKNDPNDARSVAVAAMRSAGVQEVRADDHAAVLKIWSKRYRDLGRSRTQVVCRLHAVLGELIPGGVPKAITAARAARVLKAIRAEGAVQAARWELAAAFLEDLRGIDAGIRETRKKLAAAVAAAGTSLTGLFGVGPVIAAAVIGDVRDVSRFPGRDHFAAYNGTAPIEVSSGQRKGLPAEQAREPPARPRHPHGRDHPDPQPAQPGPRLLRQETDRGQDPQRGPARAETASQQRHLRLPAGRRPARRSPCEGPGRAAGERLCRQRGRLTPQAPALRTSHSRTRSPHYDRHRRPAAWSRPRPGQSWPFLDRCHPAAGDAAGPGGAPAAKRGRTTWRCGETTATLGCEEGHGSNSAGKETAPEGHLTSRGKDRRNSLTQRGIRYDWLLHRQMTASTASRTGRYGAGWPGHRARSWHARRTGTSARLAAARR